jgi:uncharacterized protein
MAVHITRYCFIAVAAIMATACSMPGANTQNFAADDIQRTNSFVDDQADLLSTKEEDILFRKLSAAKNTYGPHLMVITVKTLKGQEIENYALKLARQLGIGDAKRDDGLLFLVAPGERKVRIEVGYGLEASFSDQFCRKLIDQIILPQFKGGKFPAGIFAGVDAMIAKMKAVPSLPTNDNMDARPQKDAA